MAKKVENLDIEQPSKRIQDCDSATLKETPKETPKENTHGSIIRLWNILARWEKRANVIGLLEAIGTDPKLESRVRQSVRTYDARKIKRAIMNYHKFMCLPHHEKRWKGYCWTLGQFLKPGQDWVQVWSDWETVKFNYLERPEENRNPLMRV